VMAKLVAPHFLRRTTERTEWGTRTVTPVELSYETVEIRQDLQSFV